MMMQYHCLDRVLDIDPANIGALVTEGRSLQALGKNKEAVTFYDKVLAIDPNDTNALYSKGNAFVYLRNYPEAIALYDKNV